ncbi:unnamed protein product, partial [Effrenium voratum]
QPSALSRKRELLVLDLPILNEFQSRDNSGPFGNCGSGADFSDIRTILSDGEVFMEAYVGTGTMNVPMDPRFRLWLAALDLQSSDAENLFTLLDDGDGSISYQEFIGGARRLKGTAQSIDLVTLMRECGTMHNDIQAVRQAVDKMADKLKLIRT